MVKSHASLKEYQKASPFVQKMADYVDAAIASLKTMEMYGTGKKSDYYAIVTISKEGKGSVIANSIVISPDERTAKNVQNKNSCTTCGLGGGIDCYNQNSDYMEANNMDEIDLHVLVNDGCATVTY